MNLNVIYIPISTNLNMSDILYINGQAVPRVNLVETPYFLNKLTMIYGQSFSGKSVLIKDILSSLRGDIPIGICCNPTNTQNGDYNGIFPEECIYDDVTKTLLQRMFQRQQNVIAMYDLVRDPEQLSCLYKKISDNESRSKLERLNGIYQKGIRDVKNSYEKNEINGALEDLKIKYNKKLVNIMRGAIAANIDSINMKSLTDVQKAMLSNFMINPRLLILIDDCASSIREWSQYEETKKLFYQGRHMQVTTIITMQAISVIPPSLRNNAHISIFTTGKAVNNFYAKATSGASPEERKQIMKIAAVVFAESDDASKPNFRKLCILGSIIKTSHPIQYIIANPKKRRFGSAALWAICEHVKREQASSLTSNSFSKMFAIKPVASLEPV